MPKSLPTVLLAFLALLATVRAQDTLLQTALDSAFLVTGEQTRLLVYLRSTSRPSTAPTPPSSEKLTIQFQREDIQRDQNRQLIYIYSYAIRSFDVGTHTIEPFSLTVGGRTLQSLPLSVRVSPLEDLTWFTQTAAGQTFQYASAIFVPEASPYEGETFPSEVKVYLPDSTGGARSGVAELDYDGLVAWRFEAVPSITQVQLPTGAHTGITFNSTASPIRSGAVSLGGGKARLVMQVRRSERGFTLVQDLPADFEVPKRTMQARPLPPGAPAGFAGAVGDFTLSATADTDELEEGDPIALRLSVSGTGNLDSLPAPRLDAPASDWKIYEPSRLERQGERRDVTGTVSFSQIIRPLTRQDQVPAFDLVFFNPRTSTYANSRTQPIPFKTTPSPRTAGSAAIIPTLATPVEDMQGILAIIDPLRATPSALPPWLRHWQVLPALLAAVLLARIARRRIVPRFQITERERQLRKAFAELSAADTSEGRFLRAAGAFVERWIPEEHRAGEPAALLARRDEDCFRPDRQDREIAPDERRSLLRMLKQRAHAAAPVLILLATLLATAPARATDTPSAPDSLKAAATAYSEGNYRFALKLYSSSPAPHSADLLYNIGNCHYQLNEPGKATLYYHRALLQDPAHPEARQNLRFLQRTLGSISIVHAPYEDALATFTRPFYTTLAAAGTWLAALALLSFFALAPGSSRLLPALSLGCGLLLAATGHAAQFFYPNDAAFAPATQRAVMIQPEPVQARTEASDTGPKAIEVPPGSLCRLLAPRGSWTYVEFPNLTRAWLPTDQIAPLVPPDPTQPEDRL